MKTKKIFIYALTSFIIYSCDDSGNTTTTVTNTSNTTTVSGDTSNDKINVTEVIKEGSGLIKEVIDDRRRNDSIRNANKEPLWVYKIGSKIDDEDLAAQTYDKLKDISHLYLFKKSKHEFYIVKDDGFNEDQLRDSLGSVKKRIAAFTSDRVEMIDLAQQCSSKKIPTLTDPVKYKVDKERMLVDCRACE